MKFFVLVFLFLAPIFGIMAFLRKITKSDDHTNEILEIQSDKAERFAYMPQYNHSPQAGARGGV